MAAESPLSQLSSTTVATIIALCGELDAPFTLTVCGQSMVPVLRDGDKVLLHPPRRPLRRGDIVVRKCGDEILMHRVVGLRRIGDEIWVMTKGDNSLTFDEPVPASEVLGLVAEILTTSRLDLRRGHGPRWGCCSPGIRRFTAGAGELRAGWVDNCQQGSGEDSVAWHPCCCAGPSASPWAVAGPLSVCCKPDSEKRLVRPEVSIAGVIVHPF